MEATYTVYNFKDSIDRISEILDSADSSYEDRTTIPVRSSLTFTNGYYVPVSVLFVDMRGSSALADVHTRPVLAKIYRAYISEVVASLKGNPNVSEIYIEGDGLWAVFNTSIKSEVDSVLDTAAHINSLTHILNVKLAKKKYSTIKIGIGLDFGESLYIKAGYKNSGINEVVWIGKVVGGAAHLCKNGNRNWSDGTVMASKVFRDNLATQKYKDFFTWNASRDCFQCEAVRTEMEAWVTANG